MIKNWTQKALEFLNHSLNPVPQELNKLDWMEGLSPDNAVLYGLTDDEIAVVEGKT